MPSGKFPIVPGEVRVATTVLDTVSMTDTEFEVTFETQTCWPSGRVAMPIGDVPTVTVPTTKLVPVLMTDTFPLVEVTTYANSPLAFDATATTVGPLPTVTVPVT